MVFKECVGWLWGGGVEVKNVVVANLFSIWCDLGDMLYNKRNLLGLALLICGEEVKECLEDASLCFFWTLIEGKK
ncbi:hypothetical protein CK203_087082 [Vitis vinifera]|uniref:Uncharacterized protein n=1 Tax=Vitis vinifera TaxID=29760 RepID=A0A438EB11_VITVI|nr:hypothetical protein CK203_087082 [Vitis vinifera]